MSGGSHSPSSSGLVASGSAICAGMSSHPSGFLSSGSSFEKCREITRQILHKDKKCELDSGCSFDGAWGGGLGPALKQPATHAHLLSYFFDRLSHVKAGTFQEGVTGTANLHDLKKKAVALCKFSHEELDGLKAGDGEDDTFSSAPQSK